MFVTVGAHRIRPRLLTKSIQMNKKIELPRRGVSPYAPNNSSCGKGRISIRPYEQISFSILKKVYQMRGIKTTNSLLGRSGTRHPDR